MGSYSENLIWMDLEMTGLDPEAERIIEIATIVTDSSLNILEEGPVLVVAQSETLLAGMDDWNREHHTSSGLVDRVLSEGIAEADAEAQTIDFISRFVSKGESPLCGNSIAQDRRFLVRYMPLLDSYLHYRNLDVSTVKELALRWRPDIADGVQKTGTHRALDDIKESINELQHYRSTFFQI
jgi:oligoribonuclease|tara:strand:+ start:215 stop:760 length:546 start_codon:yes stop_codon:yes gene_type:complete